MSEILSNPRSTRVQGRDPALSSLIANAVCLDFVNTVGDRTGRHGTDTLTTYDALVQWAWHAWVIEPDQRDRLLDLGKVALIESNAALAQALDLREAIYRIFAAIAAERSPNESDLDILKHSYLTALAQAHLVHNDRLFVWNWKTSIMSDNLDLMLWPIAQSAVDLLTSPQIERVKECPGNDCGWLFLDTSKNGTRRWCSMEECGSRAKMRRHYARSKTH